ncbi:class I SAM-dependent methyltransferase [Rhizobium phaseoli]|uniref:class I SAM-dependent methyltransferase n=1 Tax=Rhizobium phaseoli TaxID=396 RepID=UPI0007EAAF3D|nr:class I SAM-dependent methyltransferase [Rhizobium phaseoli]ANL34652.1 SAM-dependent methyltransferase protein [Rhizobium phaseoli]ANL98374.1 SAM-dependent methyltransferase protein [Rhizobium phaseoli]
MTDAKREHWDEVYRTKAADSVSWYQPTPEPSLRALDERQLPVTTSLIDVGGGASSLVDRLVERGWSDLTVLDIAEPALDVAKARLGDAAARIAWVVDDVTVWRPERRYDVWHDRAVFHFLTEPEQRLAYRRALEGGTSQGSIVIIATFAPDGPERCSGLPVQRYDAAALATAFSSAFTLEREWCQDHTTPGGGRQPFQWCVFRKC